MAKGHRLLKKKKLEKNKVKLKVSHAKTVFKKGENITDTSFKVKPIIIREQLKIKSQDAPLSKRKLNVKELLMKLHHYNSSIRGGTIKELKEFLSYYPEEIIKNFAVLLSGVSHLVLDQEKTIRREALKTIAIMLSQATVEQIVPFFDILSSYLRCAMTHIDSNIQEDSLFLLDTLLEFSPSLVVSNTSKIMPNFFDLISKLRNDFKPGRTLTMNLGRKITVVKWRIEVLDRLYCILKVIIEQYEEGKINMGQKVLKFDENYPYLSLYKIDFTKPCILKLSDTKISNSNEDIDSNHNIMNYMEILMPLLYESWLEVGPASADDGQNTDSALSEEALRILNSILKVLGLIFSYIKIYENETGRFETTKNFIAKYKEDYLFYIMRYFPYTQAGSGREESCYLENLMICKNFCLFYKSVPKMAEKKHASKLLEYIQSCLKRWRYMNSDNSTELIQVLKIVLFDLTKTWKEFKKDMNMIIDETLSQSMMKEQSKSNKEKIQSLVCNLVVSNVQLNENTKYKDWLVKIPELLLEKDISEKMIDNILLLVKQRNTAFIEMLKNIYKNILENISKINITDTEDAMNAKTKIISLTYYVVDDKNIGYAIQDFLNSNVETELKKYLHEILVYKFGSYM